MKRFRLVLCLIMGHRFTRFMLPHQGIWGDACHRCGWVRYCDCSECSVGLAMMRDAAKQKRRAKR